MAGINIEFVSDVRRFLGGTKDIEGALDDVADSLDDLGKDAQKTGDKIGESLESAGDEAKDAGKKIGTEIEDGAEKGEDAAEKLERKFRDAFDEVKGGARKAGDGLGDDIKRGAGEAEEGLDNFKEESRDTAREVAASFDGSAESIAGGFQEVLANAFVGFGPVGAAAGIAAAAGAGLFYAKWQENAQKTEQRVEDMYDDMLASGLNFLSEEFINEQASKIIRDQEDAIISLAEAEKIAADSGIGLQTVIRGYSGDAQAMTEVNGFLEGSIGDLTARAQEYAANGDYAMAQSLRGQIDALTDAKRALDSQGQELADVREKMDIYRSTVQPTAEAAREFTIAQGSVAGALVETKDKIRENTEAFGDNADQLREQNEVALASFAEELVGVNEAARAAGQTGDELTRTQERQYGAFMAAAEAAGITEQAAHDLAKEWGLVPGTVTTNVMTPGMAEALRNAKTLAELIEAVPDYKRVTLEAGGKVPGRASGGPVSSGSYLVGEHGPEVVTMRGPGTVTPNVNLTGGGGKVALDDASINKLARAILAGAQVVSAGAVADNARAQHLAGRGAW